ncbi:MAG: response regulator transcription factor [Planctomycetaceae bacterium]
MANSDLTKILIVDDNREIHKDYEKILLPGYDEHETDAAEAAFFGEETLARKVEPQYHLDHAYQGQEAMEMVQSAAESGEHYTFAFVDMRMPPGWDGVETIENLWTVDPKLQVVVCTAYSDYSWEEMITRLGTTDKMLILKKPFDNVEVQQLALALTEKRRLADLEKWMLREMEELACEKIELLEAAQSERDQLLGSAS